jgi:endonuclease YncB( thermonuclease family)
MKFNLRVCFLFGFVTTSHLAACVPTPIPSTFPSDAMLTGHARAYDGDSIFFGHVEVRLEAIDAPERDQACLNRQGRFFPCGIASRDALRAMMADKQISCTISGKDKYRRLLGTCYAGGRDLNAAMVEEGYAIAYHYFSERYARQERRAKALHTGIWQDANFTEPYLCRHPQPGHTCYEYDYAAGTGRVAILPLIGKSHAVGAPD